MYLQCISNGVTFFLHWPVEYCSTFPCNIYSYECQLIIYTMQQWQQLNKDQDLNSQQTPHVSPVRAKHGVSIVSILGEDLLCCDGTMRNYYPPYVLLPHKAPLLLEYDTVNWGGIGQHGFISAIKPTVICSGSIFPEKSPATFRNIFLCGCCRQSLEFYECCIYCYYHSPVLCCLNPLRIHQTMEYLNKNTLETCKTPRPTSGWSELTKSCTTSTMNFHMAYFSWIPQNNARLKLSCKFGESKCNPC